MELPRPEYHVLVFLLSLCLSTPGDFKQGLRNVFSLQDQVMSWTEAQFTCKTTNGTGHHRLANVRNTSEVKMLSRVCNDIPDNDLNEAKCFVGLRKQGNTWNRTDGEENVLPLQPMDKNERDERDVKKENDKEKNDKDDKDDKAKDDKAKDDKDDKAKDDKDKKDEKDEKDEKDKCAIVYQDNLHIHPCNDKLAHICEKYFFVLVKEEKSWEEALLHCRAMGVDKGLPPGSYDLLSLHTHEDLSFAQEELVHAGTREVWVGLRWLAARWLWMDGEEHSVWKCPADLTHCGSLSRQRLDARSCMEKRNFFCQRVNAVNNV
ncbi:unnamed protein product [Gadus morhua 'NCC']